MTSLPPVPHSLASAAGGTSRPTHASSPSSSAAGSAASPGVAASGESGDRDADGRDLTRRDGQGDQATLESARQDARGTADEGGLDVVV